MTMPIWLVTPAPEGARTGNRVTALRWADLLRQLGHEVEIATDYDGQPCDLLIALHARKSHAAIARFHVEKPDAPLIVAISGTDLYEDMPHSAEARQSLDWATRIVVLQGKAIDSLPPEVRSKARVILQSAVPPPGPFPRSADAFDVCVMGHLRPVKDPLRAAHAAHLLPATSRIRILQVGSALTPEDEAAATQEMKANPRYEWLGDKPQDEALRMLGGCRLLALTSFSEGGANVISEAIVLGVPVIASQIDGSVGLLGEDYPGYFPAGDTEALARLLHRCETDTVFLQELTDRCARLRHVFTPANERESWRELLAELASGAASARRARP
jgi:putative glycosyltransferase (TIGR04348 family)